MMPRKRNRCNYPTLLKSIAAATLILGLTAQSVSATETANRRPDIVFIMADDLGWADVGYHGSEIATPNIDWLADKGVRLEQHYVQPMCTPTRVALMTGRYPSRFGTQAIAPSNEQVLPFGTVTLASALKSTGYHTAISGKWHLGSKPEWGPLQFGFDESYGALAGGVGPYNHRYKKGPYSFTWHRNDKLVEEDGHATDLIAREAVRFIQEAGSDPLFLYVPFTAVHTPVEVPKQWFDFYEGKIDDESYRLYAAYTTQMDDGIGKIISALRDAGRLKNTLIVFTSDNGAIPGWKPSGQYPGEYKELTRVGGNLPYRGYKAELYEGGIRAPTVVYWPGVLDGGKRVDAPMHIVDWMPVLCGIAGYKQNENLGWDGRDIIPLLTGKETTPEPRDFYWKFVRDEFAVRSGDWKLIIRIETEELYNLANDPYEKENIAKQHPEQVSRLKELLYAFATHDREMFKRWQGVKSIIENFKTVRLPLVIAVIIVIVIVIRNYSKFRKSH